ncbi:Clavaminate synthase-like protein [Cucurbitaria berberidis CBS 394.84]|uniref:Clavaminate synthase-like protein n=1 Tax=Cucurbitaria berberidis CBS 394.84 TaxID=1168544 RepID=A0A9P4GU00_9PLEO|nr:Clavaminate synthase-like protein [Cucurbitaria berberidis CBS 394.84]KAF1851259.1 Clavaminate synthase-like protein [Cucurbitaria berberidis CBS 394.84]
MAKLPAFKHISPDSGFPITLHPAFNPKINTHIPPESPHPASQVDKDRATFADPSKASLLSIATRTNLTKSLITVLSNIQLSQLTPQQLDKQALLVTKRGVVFLRDQDLTTNTQVQLFQHSSILDKHPAQKNKQHITINGSTEDHRDLLSYSPWPSGDFHADTDALKKHVDGLHAVHTSRLQYDTILDLWGTGPNRPPALNINSGFVTGFAELKKKESDHLVHFFDYHIHSADDHQVRWKWAVGSVAMWDNRCTVHRVILGTYQPGSRRGVRTTVFGEKPMLYLLSDSMRWKRKC